VLGVLVMSACLGAVALRTRRWFAWDEAIPALMLLCAGLMVVVWGSLAFDGRWLAALLLAPLTAAVVAPAVILGRVPRPVSGGTADDEEDEDDGPGGGPPKDPPPDPPQGGIPWDSFDDLREAWAREGSRAGV